MVDPAGDRAAVAASDVGAGLVEICTNYTENGTERGPTPSLKRPPEKGCSSNFVWGASLLPEPACNAMQEFVCASELIDLGYPVSSPSVVELVGDHDPISASTPLT